MEFERAGKFFGSLKNKAKDTAYRALNKAVDTVAPERGNSTPPEDLPDYASKVWAITADRARAVVDSYRFGAFGLIQEEEAILGSLVHLEVIEEQNRFAKGKGVTALSEVKEEADKKPNQFLEGFILNFNLDFEDKEVRSRAMRWKGQLLSLAKVINKRDVNRDEVEKICEKIKRRRQELRDPKVAVKFF